MISESTPPFSVKDFIRPRGRFRKETGGIPELSPPSGLALTSDGGWVVADDFNHRIQIYNPDCSLKHTFGEKGRESGQFQYPKGLTVDKEGCIYITDSWNHRVQKFDPDGAHLLSFGAFGDGQGQLNEPYDVLVEDSGDILVVERYNHRIQFFDSEGISRGWRGSRGTILEDQLAGIYETSPVLFPRPVFEFPTSIDRDSRGNYLIADSGNHRIVKFDSQWNWVADIGGQGAGPGRFEYPFCAAVGPNDLLYVADLNNNCLQVFTGQGQFLFSFDKGEGDIKTPCLVAIDAKGILCAGMTFNSAIETFDIPTGPADYFYRKILEAEPENTQSYFYFGRHFEEQGQTEEARNLYGKGLDNILSGSESNIPCDPASEVLFYLPTQYAGLLPQNASESDWYRLLDISSWYQTAIESTRRAIIELKENWESAAQNASHLLVAEENLILQNKEDPLSFNKKLFFAEKKEKEHLFQMKTLYFAYRSQVESWGNCFNRMLQLSLTPELTRKLIEILKQWFQSVCRDMEFFLDRKEKNEETMVKDFAGCEEDQEKWSRFRSKFQSNDRTLELILQFEFELRLILKQFKSLARCTQADCVATVFRELFSEPPHAGRIHKILLGLQESRKVHPILERTLRNMIDTLATLSEDEERGESHPIDINILQPVPFDFEETVPEDILKTWMLESTPIELTGNGLAIGLKMMDPQSLAGQNETLLDNMLQAFAALSIYDQQSEEILNNLENLTLQKASLESNLRQVDPRNKQAPIPLRNNGMIVEFQIGLLHRMAQTLTINEMNNISRMVTGCAVLISLQKNNKTSRLITLLDEMEKAFLSWNQNILEISKKRHSVYLEKAALSDTMNSDLSGKDTRTMDNLVELRNRQIRLELDFERLDSALTRLLQKKNLLGRLWDFQARSANGSASQPHMQFLYDFGGVGSEPGGLMETTHIAHWPDGSLATVDSYKGEIQIFSRSGIYKSRFGERGNTFGAFREPVGIQIDSENCVYVADRFNHRVQKFSADGTFLQSFGDKGSSGDKLGMVFSVALDSQDNVWAADTSNNRVICFSQEGKRLQTIDRNLTSPISLCFIDSDNLVVGDRSESALKRMNLEGEVVASLKRDETMSDAIYNIAYNKEKGLFAADSWAMKLYRLDENLEPLWMYSQFGRQRGQFSVLSGLAVFEDTLWITDFETQRISVFKLP